MEPSDAELAEIERIQWEMDHEAEFEMQMEMEDEMRRHEEEEQARKYQEEKAIMDEIKKRNIAGQDDTPHTAAKEKIALSKGSSSRPNTATPYRRKEDELLNNAKRSRSPHKDKGTSVGAARATQKPPSVLERSPDKPPKGKSPLREPSEPPAKKSKSGMDWKTKLNFRKSKLSTDSNTAAHTSTSGSSQANAPHGTGNDTDETGTHSGDTHTRTPHSSGWHDDEGSSSTQPRTTDRRSNSENVSAYTPTPTRRNITTVRPTQAHMEIRSIGGEETFYVKKRVVRKGKRTPQRTFSNLLGRSIHDIIDELDNERMEKVMAASKQASDMFDAALNETDDGVEADNIPLPVDLDERPGDQLWVTKYSPKSYMELLSDEGSNREAIRWLKSWDHCVFGTKLPTAIERYLTHTDKSVQAPKSSGPWVKNWVPDYDTSLYETKRVMGPVDLLLKDTLVRPFNKVLLICGPPGLGKTTLAHIIATQCGYSPIEMNASDDRQPEVFKAKLETTLNIGSISFGDNRPKCLIVDEIDGAHAGAVKHLVNRLNEIPTKKTKAKKSKNKIKGHLRRPIICICNNLYAPALRPLRSIAHVLRIQEASSGRKFVNRLNAICRREGLTLQSAAMSLLCDMAGSDIRTSLNTLQFLKRKKTCLTVQDIRNSGVGQKDSKVALNELWGHIFRMPSKRKRNMNIKKEANEGAPQDDTNVGEKVLHVIRCYGDYNFLMNGCFENYLKADYTDAKFHRIPQLMEWVALYDTLNTTILTTQNYKLMGYLPYAVYSYYNNIAGYNEIPKYDLPNTEHKNTLGNSLALLKEMKAHKLMSTTQTDLVMDYCPYLLHLTAPKVHGSRVGFMSANDRGLVDNLVHVLVDYGLDFLPFRNETGSFVYELQPDLFSISRYHGDHEDLANRLQLAEEIKRHLNYTAQSEKYRRIAETTFGKETTASASDGAAPESQGKAKDESKGRQMVKAPITIDERLRAINSNPRKRKVAVPRDFFGRVVEAKPAAETVPTDAEGKPISIKPEVTVWLSYNQGFTNAVKRPVKVTDLL